MKRMMTMLCLLLVIVLAAMPLRASAINEGNKQFVDPIEDESTLYFEKSDLLRYELNIDTGNTLKNLKRLLLTRNPKSLKICSLLDKPSRRKVEMEGDYVGFTVPNEFVVGYGLDYNEKYRNLPDIGILKPEIYQ